MNDGLATAPRAPLGARGRLLDALAALIASGSTGRRAAVDRSVFADLDVGRHADPLGLPAGLELEWLGTAGFRLSLDDTTLLIDPYLSRRDLPTTLGAPSLHADRSAIDATVQGADAVLVGHRHFDHAVDVPELARRGATVYGSSSVRHLLGLHGLADRSVVVAPDAVYEVGPFTVRFVPSRHSKLLAGLAVPSSGELTCDHLDGLAARAYRCGAVHTIHVEVAGVSIAHVGSAELVEEAYRLGPVDLLLACIAGRSFTEDFAARLLGTFDPGIVVPHHYDDFFRPLDQPMGLSPNVAVHRFVDDVRRVDPHAMIRTLSPLRTLRGGAHGEPDH